jgi:hypothetical protein
MRERTELIGVADPRRDGAAGGPAHRATTKTSTTAAKAARNALPRKATKAKTTP